MKDNELQSIWKGNIDKQIQPFSKEELDTMLLLKVKARIRKFYPLKSSVIVIAIVILFLTKISFDRLNDILLVINNLVLILSGGLGVCLSMYSYNKMLEYDTDQPLKEWLEYRIKALKKASKFKPVLYVLFPLFVVLSGIATTSLFDNLSFHEIISSSSFISKSISYIIGSLFAAYILNKYSDRKYKNILEDLNSLYKEVIEKEEE